MTFIDELPKPSDAALSRSRALTEVIQQKMDEHGAPLSFATFMELALYHPSYGYYNASTFDLGKQGDFTTAPEISPLFAECVANQCVQIFSALPTREILELGAGTGRFAADLLRALNERDCLPSKYYIYEISVHLRKKQHAFLQTHLPEFLDRIVWLETLPTAFIGIVIANEVLDALPVHCFRIEHGEIKERCVAWNNNQFVWQLTTPSSPPLTEHVLALQQSNPMADGYESEVSLGLPALMQALISALTKGVILLMDYGYGQQEYYRPERAAGTLTCFYQHHHHDNPLLWPGLQDITAHVNFTQVISLAASLGCTLLGYTTQAAFLLSLDFLVMAAKKEIELSEVERMQFHQALKLLTLPMEMGERVKVMALGKEVELSLKGFEFQDRSREL